MSLSRLIMWAVLFWSTVPLRVADLGAQESPTPTQQAQFLLRAFSFDRALEDRGALKIAVLYPEEASEAQPMQIAFGEIGSTGAQGMPVTAIGVRFESVALLLERLDAEGVTAVYVPETLATALSSILQVTRARGLVSLSGGLRLAQQGVSMGVFLSENGPRLILNRRSLQIEGADLSAELLSISEIIR